MSTPSSVNTIKETILRYENFINDVLKEDLRTLENQLKHINREMSDLIEQKHTLQVITDKEKHPKGFKTQMNIGCNFFLEAAVPDTSTLLMNIGLNHYLELALPEAQKYLDVRLKTYEKASNDLFTRVAETKAHIKLLLFGIEELQAKSFNIR